METPWGGGQALKHANFLSHPLLNEKTRLWQNDDLPASTKQQRTADSKRSGIAAPRGVSLAPQRRGAADTAHQDSIILQHLSGERDAFDDESAFLLDDVFKTALSDVQKHSPFFRGFSETDLQELFPFLSHFPYKNGDILAQRGEAASWCGVLLTGRIEARDADEGSSLSVLVPGTIVGEMSLFRGGTRFCDLVGRGKGSLAALLYEDIPALYARAPAVAHRLIQCFGKSATCKLVQPHPPPVGGDAVGGALVAKADPAGQGRKRLGFAASDSAERLRVVSNALQRGGMSEDESAELLSIMVVEDCQPHQVVLHESKGLRHAGIVLQGSIVEGDVSKGVGELIGAWFALSGHPVHQRVVGGSQGCQIGFLELDRIGELAATNGALAFKALKLIGLGATAQAEGKSEDDDFRQVTSSLGAKLTEVLYRNKIKDVEAKASVMQDEADRATHDKHRNALLLKKVQRAHASLSITADDLREQLKEGKAEKDKLEATLKKRDKEVAALNSTVDGLKVQLDVSRSDMSTEDSELTAKMMELRDKVASGERVIAELNESLEKARADLEEQSEVSAQEFRTLKKESAWLNNKTVTQFRWRVFILLILLDKKRKAERKVRMRNKVVEWLSGKQTQEAGMSLEAVRFELDETTRQLSQTSAESAELREAAAAIAEAKAHLEAQQGELVRTTKAAIGRDEQLELTAKAAEERAFTAAQRTEVLVNERLQLRWAVREAEDRIKDGAGEAAKLVAERDASLAELAEVRQHFRQTSGGLKAAQRRVLELEATLLAERASFGARVADAEHTAREGAEALHKVRRLEAQVEAANAARHDEDALYETQRLLLERLLELEGTFGAVLAPPVAEATMYSRVMHDLSKEQLRIAAPKAHQRTAGGDLVMPPRLAEAGAVGRRDPAAMSSSPRCAALLPASTSLPVLRTGVRPTDPSVRPLPVARGAARVAARKGISVGSRSEIKQVVAASHARREP